MKRGIDKMKIGVSLTKSDDDCKSFENNYILTIPNNKVDQHMVQVIRELSITKSYNCKDMQCIIDCLGSTEEEFFDSTNRKDCYSVYYVITTWRIYIRVNRESILLKLKAGDVLVITGGRFHARALSNTLQILFVICILIGYSLRQIIIHPI